MAAAVADSPQLRLACAKLSAIGMRSSNQDAIGEAHHDALACFVMSDGAGGHEGGEVASRLVVDAVLDKFAGEACFGARALRSYVGHAIARVAQAKLDAPRRQDMSATAAALLVDRSNGCAVWAHLGDTRVYHFRGARLLAATKDHSLTQQLIDAGYAKAEELRIHPQRNILYAAVGAEGETPAAVSDDAVELRDGDAFLMCTDGLWEWVLEADMERTLAEAAGPDAWLDAMCALADVNIAAAGKVRDNYSVYAIRVQGQDTAT
jgi:serine/threonine protein phosphatase PrpC